MRRVEYLYDLINAAELEELLTRKGPKWVAKVTHGSASNICRRNKLKIQWKLEELIAIALAAGHEPGRYWTLKTDTVPNRNEREIELDSLIFYEESVRRQLLAEKRDQATDQNKNRNPVPVLK